MCARLHVGFDNGVAVCIDESWRVLCITRLYVLQWPIYTMKKVKVWEATAILLFRIACVNAVRYIH